MAEETTQIQHEEKKLKLSQLRHVRGPQFNTVYSNYAQAGLTPWDIRLIFSEVGEGEPDEPAIIERMAVILPPAVAKALIKVLQTNINAYEDRFGEIKAPKEIGVQADAGQAEKAE